jgi:hypothetical protein
VAQPCVGKDPQVERTGITPPRAVVAPDLAELVSRPGPFASVYLVTEGAIDNAAQRAEQRWKTLRGDLGRAGAPDDLLDTIEEHVAEAHLEGDALAAFATAGAAAHIEHGRDAPLEDHAIWAPLPAVVPILQWRQSSPASLSVLADRTGADLIVLRSGEPDVHRQAGGDDDPLTKSAAGGWSQRRFQQRAENTWENNAEDVATEVAALVERFDPRVVAVAGDVRAVELIQGALPPSVADRVAVIDGARSDDGSSQQITDAIAGLVAEAVDADTAAFLEKFAEEMGQSDRAADGAAATVAALARGQVDVLLVQEDADPGRSAFFGDEPTQLGLTSADIEAMGMDEPREAPLVDVAVRAALGTGAGVRVVPPESGLTDGLAAILRWSSG